MGTKVYGASDDLIEFEGDVHGEVGYSDAGYIGSENDETAGATLLVFDDGTQLAVRYGKPGLGGVWHITALRKGPLFVSIDVCEDENADPYSDVAHFATGLKSCIAATRWERVK